MNLDAFKPAPVLDNVRLESDPPGTQVKSSNGQTCVTPCALALPTDGPVTVTFTHEAYLPDTENLQVVRDTGSAPQLQPNPLSVTLAMAPPTPKPNKRAPKKHVAAKKTANTKTAVQKTAAKRPASPAPHPAELSAATAPKPAPTPTAEAPPPGHTLLPWPDPASKPN